MRIYVTSLALIVLLVPGANARAAPGPGGAQVKPGSRLLKPFRAIGQRFKQRRSFNRDVRRARRGSTEVNKVYKSTLKTGLKWTSPLLAISGTGAVGGCAIATRCATMLGEIGPVGVLLAGPSLITTGYLAAAVAVPSAVAVGITVSNVRRNARLDAYGSALSHVPTTLSADGMRHYQRFLIKEQRYTTRRLDRLTNKRRPNETKIASERAYLQDLSKQLGQIDTTLGTP